MTAGSYLTNTTEPTDTEIEDIFDGLDTQFNEVMINALTHVLYVLATFNFYCGCAQNVSYFSITGESFWEAFKSRRDQSTPILLTMGIDAILSTVLADATLIWRCWIVWGRTWRVVLVPIACTTLAIISRGIITYYSSYGPVENMSPRALYLENLVNWAVLYSSLILATLLWCTIFIVHRILRVGGIAAGMRVYHRLIEMLVESASFYSSVIVVLLVFEVRNAATGAYIEEFAIAMRGIMPAILVGRIAAGHARPDDSWSDNSTVSSIQFRSYSSSQNDSQMSAEPGRDTSFQNIRPGLEEGLEDGTELRVEEAAPILSVHNCSTHIIGTSNSINCLSNRDMSVFNLGMREVVMLDLAKRANASTADTSPEFMHNFPK
ncbi:hypothetical protein ARMGADRAFT_1032522 [Armillaria gallica]|uniref:Uncharacterized protein n=1 Tax=Armillaria gallica TaxID=47427 RepID=A0A2H3DSV7_ARMGA|nr:hypothetical protein ARMGADRAFT_1032522 [Armillaria gallica]